MMSADELGSATIVQVLQYHGLRHNECPSDSSHELTVASDTYAICHSCGTEWNVLGLHFDLNTLDTPHHQMEILESGITSPYDVVVVDQDERVQSPVEIIDDFVAWVRANREHIMGSPEYDGVAENAIGYLTVKNNMCLLPWVIGDLTLSQLRHLEELWKQSDLIRLPSNGRGIKRSERIPVELRGVWKYPVTMKVYTFHRRETLEMLGLENKYSRKATHTA